MPIYEYLCEKCNYSVEKLEKITESEKKELCPNCKICKLKKIVSKSSFNLKGKGWYKTDYKKSE